MVKIPVKDFVRSPEDSECSTDSDDDGFAQVQVADSGGDSSESNDDAATKDVAPNEAIVRRSPKRDRDTENIVKKEGIDEILERLNKALDNDEEVDLAQYPPLFVVSFRGVHFNTQFFNQQQRRLERKKIKDGTLQK
eukprot:PhF_6_TR18370/c0_g1_i1/m.27006